MEEREKIMSGVTIICAFVVLVALGGLAISLYEDKKSKKDMSVSQ